MNQNKLNSGYYLFGGKGDVWSNTAHIAKSGDGTYRTLCGRPMLSSNWVRIMEVKHAGCPHCIIAYAQAEQIGQYSDKSIEEYADMVWCIRFGY
jgi:hypothetical protein